MKINNMEMKQHKASPVLLPHKAGALVSLIETVTMLQICLCSTFWTQHKSYAKSRFSIIRAFEKTPMATCRGSAYSNCYVFVFFLAPAPTMPKALELLCLLLLSLFEEIF